MGNLCPEFEANQMASAQSDTEVGYPMSDSGVVTDQGDVARN